MSRKRLQRMVLPLVALLVFIGYVGWYQLFRQVPQHFATQEEYFKYGSIGAEEEQGAPYWIWQVLPKIFPEYLPGPGGYYSLGMAYEQGKSLPVGISRKTIGFERVAINCALCHAATVRFTPNEMPTVYPGGPAHTFDALAYQRFLFASAKDPRFNADVIMAEIAAITQLSWLDSLTYRYLLVPATKKQLIEQSKKYAWTDNKPDWGRGRIDPFNPVKVLVLDLEPGDTIGNSDMVPIWNLKPRKNMAYHADGMNTDIDEVINSSAIGDGATLTSIPLQKLQKLKNWLMELAPPAYPFPEKVNQILAQQGKTLFQDHCATCHAFTGSKTGTVIPLAEIKTDAHRLNMWTDQAAEAYNNYANDYSWDFNHWRTTTGYVSVPLDGIWIRGPYLHNGSVPSLRDLLKQPEQRPKLFYRGYDLFEPEKVGFVSYGSEAERVGFRYDVNVPGNSNKGHLYGTSLSSNDKDALVEYMKKL